VHKAGRKVLEEKENKTVIKNLSTIRKSVIKYHVPYGCGGVCNVITVAMSLMFAHIVIIRA